METKLRIGALISGGGTNLQAIIDSCESNRIEARMVFVGSDNPKAFGLERARKHAIETFVVDYGALIQQYRRDPSELKMPADFDLDSVLARQHLFGDDADPKKVRQFFITRGAAEGHLLEKMAAFEVDLLVLAGFMRNLSPYFIDRFNGDANPPRIMNIHPALLPSFPGMDGYGDTYRYGCKIGGCSVHFIDYGEDSGPIIGQRAFPIQETDTLESIKKKGLELEWKLFPECIQLFAKGRLKVVRMTHTLGDGSIQQRRVVKIVQPG
jgi:phosphoribosylglycinamide formyltransferase-1